MCQDIGAGKVQNMPIAFKPFYPSSIPHLIAKAYFTGLTNVRLSPLSLISGRSLRKGGMQWLYFAGTSYLGIPYDETFHRLLKEGMDLFGSHYGGSRHSNITLNVYEQGESFLASWLGMPAALLASSGTLAGQLVARHLQDEAMCLYAPNIHTALQIGQVQKITDWPEEMEQIIRNHPGQTIAILCSAIDPLQTQPWNWDWIRELPPGRSYILVVDDSHGFGVTGVQGRGVVQVLPNLPRGCELILVTSLAKAWGVPAGAVAGSRERMLKLYQDPLFIGSSPPPPMYTYAMQNAGPLYEALRMNLLSRLERFQRQCQSLEKFQFIAGFPVFYTKHSGLFEFLYQKHVLISSFPYPTAQSKPVTRIVINASHTDDDIDRLAELVDEYFRI